MELKAKNFLEKAGIAITHGHVPSVMRNRG
jgi:hypothetical protein